MHDYQLDGLNWLTYSWLAHRNVILADEMGCDTVLCCGQLL